MHAKVLSIQICQYFCQSPPRVCTLVLFIEMKCPFSVRDGKPNDLVGRKGSFLNDAGLIIITSTVPKFKVSYKSVGKHFVTLLYGHQMVCVCKGYTRANGM